jgi:hypothetical protein
MKSKLIKCKTNNQLSSYNISIPNGASSTTIRSIDVPNEHAAIKLHIRRRCPPSSSTETLSIHPTFNDQLTTQTILHTNAETKPNHLVRRIITTRRTSLIESDLSHITSTIDDPPKTTINSIYDENTLKKQNGFKRKLHHEEQDKKRPKLSTKTSNYFNLI